MFNLKAIALALGVISSGVLAQVDPAQCACLKAIASAGFSDSSSLSAFCTGALSYTTPPAVTTTKTTSAFVTVTKFTTAKATSTSIITVTATVTQIDTIFAKRAALPIPAAAPADGSPLEARQSLGDLPLGLISQLCDCLGVARPAAPTVTATRTVRVVRSRTVTVTKTTTVFQRTRTTTTVHSTITIPRITLTDRVPTPTPTEISWDGLCGSEGDGATCRGSDFGTCCSNFGFCGTGAVYCGTGCQSKFGECN